MKACPYCAEEIQDAAIKCRHCGETLDVSPHEMVERKRAAVVAAPVVAPIPVAAAAWSPGVAAVLSLVIPGAGQMYKGNVPAGFGWLMAVAIGYVLLIVPGLILHVLCILNAASGTPKRA